MIIGVLLILAGEAIAFRSFNLAIEAIAFFVINSLYFAAVEEPVLEKRFGEEYRIYKRAVHRWLPRFPRETAPGRSGK